jgi:hypothetical protein
MIFKIIINSFIFYSKSLKSAFKNLASNSSSSLNSQHTMNIEILNNKFPSSSEPTNSSCAKANQHDDDDDEKVQTKSEEEFINHFLITNQSPKVLVSNYQLLSDLCQNTEDQLSLIDLNNNNNNNNNLNKRKLYQSTTPTAKNDSNDSETNNINKLPSEVSSNTLKLETYNINKDIDERNLTSSSNTSECESIESLLSSLPVTPVTPISSSQFLLVNTTKTTAETVASPSTNQQCSATGTHLNINNTSSKMYLLPSPNNDAEVESHNSRVLNNNANDNLNVNQDGKLILIFEFLLLN